MIKKQRAVFVTKEQISEIFSQSKDQGECVWEMYKLAYPEIHKKIKKVNGFPATSQEMNTYLFKKFIEFDKKHHPNVMPGGCWMNYGFTTNHELQGFVILPCDCELITEEL